MLTLVESTDLRNIMIVPGQWEGAEEVGRHYDDLDAYYREIWGEHLHHGLWRTGRETSAEAVEQLTETVTAAAQITESMPVCDVGCGYGGTSRFIVERYGAEVVGFTVSEAQYRYAVSQTVGSSNPRYELCPWERNQLGDSSCGAVVSIECLTHVPNKNGFFAEIQRVLIDGGLAAMTVWMTEPNPQGWRVRWLLEPICREGRLAGMGSQAEYTAIIRENGLEIDVFEDWSRQVRKTWIICARRLGFNLLTSRKYWRALLDRTNSNRVFALTLFRLLIAYYIGAMRYGFIVIRKPDPVSRNERGHQ